ncbi:MAG: hypothetical protein AB8F95_13595 [Bacteroidia bacterium]
MMATPVKTIIAFIVGLLCFSSAYCLDVLGKIQFKDSTWEQVTFIIPPTFNDRAVYYKIQESIRYYEVVKSKKRKRILDPEDALELQFKYLGKKVRMLTVRDKFIKLEEEGPCRLFAYHEYIERPLFLNGKRVPRLHRVTLITYFIQFKGKRRKEVTYEPSEFVREMKPLFQHCPRLAKLIGTTGFQIEDIKKIVQYYNRECQ